MSVKDIKKAGAGSQRRDGGGEHISQPALFEEDAVGQEDAAATGPSGAVGGRAAIYARVSSEQQEKDDTIESQMAAIEAYAREHSVKLIVIESLLNLCMMLVMVILKYVCKYYMLDVMLMFHSKLLQVG